MTGHRFNPAHAEKLLSKERKQLLPFDNVIEKLDLKLNDVVADLGAGNGYFTIPMAQHTTKTVYAVDIEPKMIELLRKRADKKRIDNIHYVISDLEIIGINDQSVDKVLVAFVIHEVANIANALKEIKRILKPGGTVLFVEWEATETETGPPLYERIAAKELNKVLQNSGFKTEIHQLNPANYTIKAKMI